MIADEILSKLKSGGMLILIGVMSGLGEFWLKFLAFSGDLIGDSYGLLV